jgi:hypothetical protein
MPARRNRRNRRSAKRREPERERVRAAAAAPGGGASSATATRDAAATQAGVGAAQAGVAATQAGAARRSAGSARSRERAGARERSRSRARPRAGEPARAPASRDSLPRPRAPWHPLPLAEILIAAGMVGLAVGVIDGPSRAAPALFFGLGAVALGTVEVTLREHLAGFRSHAVLLALIAVVAVHTAIVLGVSAFVRFPPAANAGVLALDLGVFLALFRFLRVRFVEARRSALARRTR